MRLGVYNASAVIDDVFLSFSILAVCFSALLLAFVIKSSKSEDGTAKILGQDLLLVTTDSMDESGDVDTSNYEIDSFTFDTLVSVDRVPEDAAAASAWYDSIEVGDVISFRYSYDDEKVTVTHRVVSKVENEDGGYTLKLAGDNKNSNPTRLYQTIDTSDVESGNYVIGKVEWTSGILGFMIIIMQFFVELF